MLQKIISLWILLMIAPASALTIHGTYKLNPVGSYYKEIEITCAAGEEMMCQRVCQDYFQCIRIEPYCLNCAGTSSLLLRTLFTQVAQSYRGTDLEIPAEDLMTYLAHEKYILLGADSVYNFYRPINSEELVQNLLSLCPVGHQQGHLAVALDEENEPAKLSFVICTGADGSAKAYQVEIQRPDLGEKPLQLKMKWNLKLN